jgi:hypothetical protein
MLKEVQREQTLVNSVQKEWNQVQQEEEEEEGICCQLLLSSLLFFGSKQFSRFSGFTQRTMKNVAREIWQGKFSYPIDHKHSL